ncbi:hypothetical protein K1T71_003302 [Dendrolimus kikuchii]|uniref:Uncharacterized protein n=1 Tax=Dendrolimus kikuchii TaxID=765133 RepID=A0ACC1DBH3_9NEOP|nr:hypothetical protein K1T71_003302 [Dendrolimus kikuchii]
MLRLVSLIFLGSFPYLFSLTGDFVFDDSEAIVKNKDVTSRPWVQAFSNDFWGTNLTSNLSHKSYRPLTVITFRLNYVFSGGRLIASHFKITNLALHVACCVIVWRTFQCILGNETAYLLPKWRKDTAFLAALLFAVHPVHVEAVSGIVGRADILAAITFFTSIIFYSKAMTDQSLSYVYLFIVVILSAMSMLFKENGVTVLGFCIVYDIISHFRTNQQTQNEMSNEDSGKKHTNKKSDASILSKSQKSNSLFDSGIRIICLILSIVLLLYERWAVMEGTGPEFKITDNPASFSENFLTRFKTYNYVYFLNFLLLIWPQWLCYDWSMGCIPVLKEVDDYRIIFVIIMYIYGLLFIRALMDKQNKGSTKRLTFLALSLIVIPYIPAANIFYPVGFVIAERILYIPSAGYCLLIIIGFKKLCRKIRKLYQIIIIVLLLTTYALRSMQRSFDWQNEYKLFTQGLSVCPLNAKVHYNVAKVLDARHKTYLAIMEYKEAIRLYPEYYQAMNNLANLLKSQHQFREAENYLRTALIYKQEFPAAWMNLGIVLAATDQYEESEMAYKTALKYRRNYSDAYYNLGNLYLELNKTEDALNSWTRAIKQNSTHALAWTNLLAMLDNTGQIERAMKIVPKALSELHESGAINFAVANIFGKAQRYKEAEAHFLKAIKLLGKSAEAIHYANLGVLYHRWKKYNLAEEMYKKALKIDPKYHSAQKNLKRLELINKT